MQYNSLNTENYIRFYQGLLSESETKKLEELIATNPNEKDVFLSIGEVWENTNTDDYRMNPVLVEKAWTKFSDLNNFEIPEVNIVKKTNSFTLILKVAAVVTFVIALSFLFNNYLSRNNQIAEKKQVEQNSNFMAIEVTDYKLPDGSVVSFNKGSTISYPELFNERIITLTDGEAFFQVVKKDNKKFTVLAGNARIEVLGTSFNVKLNPNKSVVVSVFTGKVAISSIQALDAKQFLTPGLSGFIGNDSQIRVESTVSNNVLSWKTDSLIFNNHDLKTALPDIEKYCNIKILSTEKIMNCRFTGVFYKPTKDELLDIISATLQIKVIKKGDNAYQLNGIGCN